MQVLTYFIFRRKVSLHTDHFVCSSKTLECHETNSHINVNLCFPTLQRYCKTFVFLANMGVELSLTAFTVCCKRNSPKLGTSLPSLNYKSHSQPCQAIHRWGASYLHPLLHYFLLPFHLQYWIIKMYNILKFVWSYYLKTKKSLQQDFSSYFAKLQKQL